MPESRLILLCACVLLAHPSAPSAGELKLNSGLIDLKFESDSGKLTLTRKASQVVVFEGAFAEKPTSARLVTMTHETFGMGQAIELAYGNAKKELISVFPSLPFFLFQPGVVNEGSTVAVFQKLDALSGVVRLSKPASDVKVFGTGGLLAPDKNPGSYAWTAIVEPQSRNGVVLGWLTAKRGSGVVFTKTEGDGVRTQAGLEYGRLQLPARTGAELETLAIGYFDDARLGLEEWANAVARVHRVQLPLQPAGYCTWYSKPYGGASDEKHLAEQAAFTARELAPFGYTVIQIDDHWQAGVSTNGPKRNFTTHAERGPYPAGMKAAAQNIRSLGLVPGIWFMPFAGTYYDPFFAEHQDWFVKRRDLSPYETAWGGTCLDMTHPGPREHLRSLVRRMAFDWGFTYFKMDGLWTGTGTKQQYVNSGYKDDGMGDAVFHNPEKSNIEAYRDGLRLVREEVGTNVFILGCCTPQNMRSYAGAFGLVDAMRIGPDNGAEWKSLLRGPTFGSRHYFLHGRVWYNDPDPVYVRPSMPLNHARLVCSWVAMTGQLNLHSEWLPEIPAERLELLKRSAPAHGLLPRPVDLFEKEIPSAWLLSDTRQNPRRDVLGLFNWEDKEQAFECDLSRIGLDGRNTYAVFDFWQNQRLDDMAGKLRITLPAQSCRILAVRSVAEHPQVLSTSRHVTQGIVDMLGEQWQAENKTLRGRSRVVAKDPYEIRVLAKRPVESVAAMESEQAMKCAWNEEGGLVRVRVEPDASGEVRWEIKFK